MVPIQVAIRGLRNRLGPNRAISVFHVDQPSNDFNALFEVLEVDAVGIQKLNRERAVGDQGLNRDI